MDQLTQKEVAEKLAMMRTPAETMREAAMALKHSAHVAKLEEELDKLTAAHQALKEEMRVATLAQNTEVSGGRNDHPLH